MNKEITLGFTTKLNKISELQKSITELRNSIIEDLRAKLTDMGPQGFLYDEEDVHTPLNYIYVIGDEYEELFKVDKIKINDEDNGVIFHEVYSDLWYHLSILDNDEINDIVKYIDWK